LISARLRNLGNLQKGSRHFRVSPDGVLKWRTQMDQALVTARMSHCCFIFISYSVSVTMQCSHLFSRA